MGKLEDRLKSKTERMGREGAPTAQAPVDAAPANDTAEPGTQAPAVVTPMRAPTTMPGQLGAFRNEAKKYQEQIAERDAIIDELNNSTDRVQRIKLADVLDSPYQPRLEYDPLEIDALGKTMAAAGQADPIKVRKKGDKYELISGHRRKRAAQSLGWTEIEAIVEVRTDTEAELEAMLLVVANVKLSDYELAEMYRRALDRKLFKSQEEVAAGLGTVQPAVSGRLAMLDLPAAILEMLRQRPRLLGYQTSNMLHGLLKEHPKHEDIVVQGVRRLMDEGAKQNALKGWILQALAQKTKKAKVDLDTRTITQPDGREVFRTKRTGKSVTVNIRAANLDNTQFESDLHKWLSEYATRGQNE
jgi:ParB family chromosome partitioning protein